MLTFLFAKYSIKNIWICHFWHQLVKMRYLKNERMVANLAQLHDGVHERLGAVLARLVVGE